MMNIKRIYASVISAVMALTAVPFAPRVSGEEAGAGLTASLAPDVLAPALTSAEVKRLPERFDLREKGLVSSVKNQGNFGTCWTFAASGALETSLIRNEPFTDLSELHLAYFSFYGDSTPSSPEYDPERFIAGGHISYATASYARWVGPVSERVLPYSTAEEDIDTSLQNRNDYFVTDVNMLNRYALKDTAPSEMLRFSDDEIKQMLYDENAVAVNIRYDNTCSETTFAQYDPRGGKTNHGVLIVGWDDSYSSDNFLVKPPGDGAWIVKNSWGDSWGLDGYFYVSYYDRSIADACCLKAEKAGRYDTNYQHDDRFFTAAVSPDGADRSTGYMANVFTAEKDEYISGAGFYTTDNGAAYEITVYTGLRNPSDPVSGTSNRTEKGTAKYAGYHTVNLSDPVRVKKGETFSVVAKLTNPEYFCPVPVEAAVILMENRFATNVSGISEEEIETHSSAGESFISANGTRWTDTKGLETEEVYNNPKMPDTNIKYYIGNVCLKAFGSQEIREVSTPELTESVLSSLTVNASPLEIKDSSGNPVTELSCEIPDSKDYAVFFPSGTGKITVNGKETVSGHRSEKIPLEYGENTVIITSSEENMKTTEYTVHIFRKPAAADYSSETIVFDSESYTVSAEDGHEFSDGESISDYLGQTLRVSGPDGIHELELAQRRDLSERLSERSLFYESEVISGLFSFKGNMYFSTSPDMSSPSDIHNRLTSILSDSVFRIYPGYDHELYFQIAADENGPASTVWHISIPERPVLTDDDVTVTVTGDSSFSLSVKNSDRQRVSYKTDIKYSNDVPGQDKLYSSKNIKDDVTEISDLVPGQTYSLYLKRFSDGSCFSTDVTEFTVELPGERSICSFNYEKERIIFDDSLYTATAEDGTQLRCYDIITDLTGTDVRLEDAEGKVTVVSIPARRPAPETSIDYDTGTLTGTFDENIYYNCNSRYPFDGSPTSSKELASKSGVITLKKIFASYWSAGDRISFFHKATDSEFASEMCTVIIPEQEEISHRMLRVLNYTDTSVTLEKYDGLEYGYRDDFRSEFIWQDSPEITGLLPDTRYILAVRFKAAGGSAYSRSTYCILATLPEEFLPGDLNTDSALSAPDLLIFKKLLISGVTPDAFQKRNADMNSDGKINVFDYQRLQGKILGQ